MDIIANQALVVCTKDRPEELSRLIKSVCSSGTVPMYFVIVDSSTAKKPDAIGVFGLLGMQGIQLHYLTSGAGLPLQRQIAITYIEKMLPESGIEIINFLDDDVTVPSKYFSKCKELFQQTETAIGFGAFDMNLAKARNSTYRGKIDRLIGLKGGRLFVNGVASVPKNISKLQLVRWFPGHSMSFRKDELLKTGFNVVPQMYGEDLETCLRLESRGKLYVHPEFYVHHWPSSLGRDSKAQVIAFTLGFTWRLASEKIARVSKGAVLVSWLFFAFIDLIRLGRTQSRGAYLLGLWLFISRIMQSKDLEKVIEQNNLALQPSSIQIFKN